MKRTAERTKSITFICNSQIVQDRVCVKVIEIKPCPRMHLACNKVAIHWKLAISPVQTGTACIVLSQSISLARPNGDLSGNIFGTVSFGAYNIYVYAMHICVCVCLRSIVFRCLASAREDLPSWDIKSVFELRCEFSSPEVFKTLFNRHARRPQAELVNRQALCHFRFGTWKCPILHATLLRVA